MSEQYNAGSTFAVSAALPATDDQAGYEALSWTSVTEAEILNYTAPEHSWEERQDESYSNTSSGSRKTKRRLGNASIELEYYKSNTAFNTIIRDAEASQDDVISVRFLHSNGTDARYYTVQVSKATETYGGPQDSIKHMIEMLCQTDIVRVEA